MLVESNLLKRQLKQELISNCTSKFQFPMPSMHVTRLGGKRRIYQTLGPAIKFPRLMLLATFMAAGFISLAQPTSQFR